MIITIEKDAFNVYIIVIMVVGTGGAGGGDCPLNILPTKTFGKRFKIEK